jgi:hypothetical protein
MQKVATAEERREKMAQQRQLALSRQRNAVLSGLGVMANRDVPAGASPMQQHKSRLGRLLNTGGSREKAYGRQDSMGGLGARQSGDVLGPPQSAPTETSPRQNNGPVMGADGIEICRLSTPLIVSKQGVDVPSPSTNNQALWNLQADVPQLDSGNVDNKKTNKRGSGGWRPWQKKATVNKQESDTRASPDPDDNCVTEMIESLMESESFEDPSPGAWDKSHMTPNGPAALGGRGPAPEKRAAAGQPATVMEVGELMPGRPETPQEVSALGVGPTAATSPKAFCRPERIIGSPSCGMADPFDDLQEMLLSN